MKRIIAGIAGAALACAALAGCSSNNTPSAATTSTTAKSSTTTTNYVPGTTTIPYIPALNARQDVSTTGCNQVDGSWVLDGSVTNSASKTRTFQIVVDFVTQPGDTVLDTQIVYVRNLAPKATKTWSATGAAGKTSVGCFIRQVQAG